MSWQRILVAVDDSPAGLRAARLAIELAAERGARLRAVTVLRPGGTGLPNGEAERRSAAAALARFVEEQGSRGAVEIEVAELEGDPFRCILEQARRWEADVVVMGRSDRRGPSSPYLGSVTEHVLEFADCPVLVVPQAR